MRKIISFLLSFVLVISLLPIRANAASIGYKDIENSRWSYDAIAYCKNNGLMNGVSEDEFAPTLNITRAMAITVLYRIDPNADQSILTEPHFSDVPRDTWYTVSSSWAYVNDILPDNRNTYDLRAADVISRAELAYCMFRTGLLFHDSLDSGVTKSELKKFKDADKVPDYARYAMCWCIKNGFLEGVGDNYLNPLGNTTREQLATVIMRLNEVYKKQAVEAFEFISKYIPNFNSESGITVNRKSIGLPTSFSTLSSAGFVYNEEETKMYVNRLVFDHKDIKDLKCIVGSDLVPIDVLNSNLQKANAITSIAFLYDGDTKKSPSASFRNVSFNASLESVKRAYQRYNILIETEDRLEVAFNDTETAYATFNFDNNKLSAVAFSMYGAVDNEVYAKATTAKLGYKAVGTYGSSVLTPNAMTSDNLVSAGFKDTRNGYMEHRKNSDIELWYDLGNNGKVIGYQIYTTKEVDSTKHQMPSYLGVTIGSSQEDVIKAYGKYAFSRSPRTDFGYNTEDGKWTRSYLVSSEDGKQLFEIEFSGSGTDEAFVQTIYVGIK